jgi:lipoyl(octanoyl) transferase
VSNSLPPQNDNLIHVRHLGLRDYETVWQEMQAFTESRNTETADEIWLVQHSPVFTLGLNGKPEHILDAGNIPVVKCDRGGQVTYHGPGQLVVYLLLDLRRRDLGVKALVYKMEQAIIDLLAEFQITGKRREGAPGIYVNGAKIAALGLRVRRGCCYHGLSLNVDMDLTPFARINPCGYSDLRSAQLSHYISQLKIQPIETILIKLLNNQLTL